MTILGGRTRTDRSDRAKGADGGFTLVEILVSVVLIGGAVVAILAALNASVNASRLNRDHTKAHAWLQTATDLLYGAGHQDCNPIDVTDEESVYEAYLPVVKQTPNPEGWADWQMTIVRPILFWDGQQYGTVCYDDFDVSLQLITLEVKAPDGRIIESVEVVKGGL